MYNKHRCSSIRAVDGDILDLFIHQQDFDETKTYSISDKNFGEHFQSVVCQLNVFVICKFSHQISSDMEEDFTHSFGVHKLFSAGLVLCHDFSCHIQQI